MCLNLSPKIPDVKPLPPAPKPKPAPDKPKDPPKAKPLRDPEDKAKVEYGSKPSDVVASKTRTNQSIINLNRSSLNSAGARQQGLGGTAA